MDRYSIDQSRVDALRAEQKDVMPEYSDPLPGTALKHDDDVLWLGFARMRVVWGFDDPARFLGYSPDDLGDYVVPVEGIYIDDRAPADPQETPMPIYPQQQQQRQAGGDKVGGGHDRKKALQAVLRHLKPADAKRVRELVRAKHPELLGGGDKDPA